MFNGTYDPRDITVLLDPVPVSTAKGQHAAKAAAEFIPDLQYEKLFLSAVLANGTRLARDVARVALALNRSMKEDITLVTLVRAGTPTGVLVLRALRRLGRRAVHYSINSVRNRGIDENALDYILHRHSPTSVTFLDGWTGKGFIAHELADSIASYNASRGVNLNPSLSVLADLAGAAAITGSGEDYLIPFSMMLATVCGLIGPSFASTTAGAFDSCLYFDSLLQSDLSTVFIALMDPLVQKALVDEATASPCVNREELRRTSNDFVAECITRFDPTEGRNSVKPGICEANRALLTRMVPMALLVRNTVCDEPDLRNLRVLAKRKGLPIVQWSDMPYRSAVVLNPSTSTLFEVTVSIRSTVARTRTHVRNGD